MDTTLRYRMFRLATHYWEGAWIKECKTTIHSGNDQLKDTKGVKKTQRKWRRWAKIFPCTVSTFHKFPDAFSAWEGDKKYLYDFIDLLVVDEAGQVSPEVAGASFSLAKKALVVGDVKQIEPVWSIREIVDRGNMLKSGIVDGPSEDEFERMKGNGRSASMGSVMRMAHAASPFHYDRKLEKGMYLYEHRRCADPIIQYCNRLCYGGKLVPRQGEIEDRILPYWGYAHIVGKSEKSGGSRSNPSEARAIASWISENKGKLESHYDVPIHEIVGVVTPFASQSRLVSSMISGELGPDHKITVGTVHALQGAERRIVIFSSVYSGGDFGQSLFFDRNENMLNVAVSRAQDSFLVFGNMNIFNEKSKSPSGIMAEFLFENSDNELSIVQPSRDDLISPGEDFKILKTLESHNEALENILKTANKEVIIVSPWIKAKAISFLESSLKEAIKRGLSVTVYTDKNFNEGEGRKDRDDFVVSLTKLESMNISVKVVDRVHSKLLIKDSELMCIGSFNWLSASRHQDSARMDTSVMYRNTKVKDEIDAELKLLDTRLIRMPRVSKLV
ncbi:MAG: AAA domain-containing protein [Nitrospirae bacterium]|nr:AAA domain-containing protein [Nitrospirota bacterium]